MTKDPGNPIGSLEGEREKRERRIKIPPNPIGVAKKEKRGKK
jgi:hypothetical protein